MIPVMCRRLCCAVAAAVSCAHAAAGDGVARRFLFDGRRIVDPGLTFTFSRASATTDAQGNLVEPDTARFGEPALLCGAPLVQVMPGTAGYGNVSLLGAGVSSDNTTPMFVVMNYTLGRVRVVLGDLPPFECDATPNAAKGGQPDFLRESVDNSPDEAWTVRAAVVCHGVAVAMCNVAVRDDQGRFFTNRIGFASCRASDLSGPRQFWWRRVAYSDVLTDCPVSPRLGNTWSMQTWFAPGQEGQVPTRAWLAAADYRAEPCKDGGLYCVIPLTRSGTTTEDWSVGAPVELPGRFWQTNSGTHAHAAALTRFGAHGLVAIGARGDSLFNNTDYTWTLADEADYRAGATVPPGALNYYTGPTSWSAPMQAHGTIVEPNAPIGQRAMGNQWVSAAPGPVPGTFITGADEVNQSLWITSSLADDPSRVRYTPIYAPAPTNWIQPPGYLAGTVGRYLAFHIAPSEPRWQGNGYVSQLGPGNASGEHSLNARVLYSPDGVNWGQFWAHRENEQSNVALVGGRAYTGSIGLGTMLGVRSTPAPAWRLLRPLRLAPGAMNYVRPDALVPVNLSPDVTVSPGTDPAPCSGPVVRVVAGVPAGAPAPHLGTLTLAGGLPPEAGVVRLRLWVRVDTPAEGGSPGSLGVQFALRRSNPLLGASSEITSSFSSAVFLPGTGVWTPVIFSCDLAPWLQDLDPSRLDLVIAPANGQWVPGSFQLAAESLAIGGSVPVPAAPQTTGDDERAVVTLPAPTADWTVLLAGAVPPDSWDSMFVSGWYPLSALAVLSDATGDNRVDVLADVTSNAMYIRVWHGDAYLNRQVIIPSIYYSTGSPLLLGISCDAATQRLTVRASLGGSVIAGGSIDNVGSMALSRVGLCAPPEGLAMPAIDWFGGLIDGVHQADATIDNSLRSLDFLMPTPCPSDFDHDGFVNGDDFDAFTYAFVYGLVDADFDGNGFVNGDDFDGFVIAFENGC